MKPRYLGIVFLFYKERNSDKREGVRNRTLNTASLSLTNSLHSVQILYDETNYGNFDSVRCYREVSLVTNSKGSHLFAMEKIRYTVKPANLTTCKRCPPN